MPRQGRAVDGPGRPGQSTSHYGSDALEPAAHAPTPAPRGRDADPRRTRHPATNPSIASIDNSFVFLPDEFLADGAWASEDPRQRLDTARTKGHSPCLIHPGSRGISRGNTRAGA